MDSGLFAKVFSSPEVIIASLALIFLLPLVFFIASTRSRRRYVRSTARPTAARPGRAAPAPRSAEKNEEPEDQA